MNTVDPKEIQNFSKDSSHWWDQEGPFAPLHRLNPVRLGYIKEQICSYFKRDERSFSSLTGLRLLDTGCGGGLISEPMARLGAVVTGIDADAQAIEVARAHAKIHGLNIDYKNKATSDLLAHRNQKSAYDVVLALEIVEHVREPAAFITECFDLCAPGGLVIFSTLNRTPASYALGIVAAEHILRWVPAGTHDWDKFIKPSELAQYVRAAGGICQDIRGMVFSPLKGQFVLSRSNVDVNYFMCCHKPA